MNSDEIQSIRQTKDELLKALQSDFATNVNKIYVNTLKKEVGFKEITVQKQKNLSRILIGNENRKDIVYDAQCAMINDSALADDFDVYELTEFDRIKLLMALYQANMFADQAKFICPVCGMENKYQVNFDNVLYKLDQFDISPQKYEYENKKHKYSFTISYPLVKRVSLFNKARFGNGNAVSRRSLANDSISHIEYMQLFVEKIIIENKEDGTTRTIDFNDFNVTDVTEIFEMFPQDVIYSTNGIISTINTKFLNTINQAFDKHTCYNCNHVYEEENSNQVESFL